MPVSPTLLKGALVVYHSQTPGPPPKIIVFQYNPEQLERKLENRASEQKRGANAKEDVLRDAIRLRASSWGRTLRRGDEMGRRTRCR